MDLKKKTSQLLIGSFLVYALLVATHLGEFWPFSVYPMFSQAGRPWNRSLVRDVDANMISSDDLWKEVKLGDLPGEPVPMVPLGISQNDMANMVSKTKVWDSDRVLGLRKLFDKYLDEKIFLVFKAHGEKVDNEEEPVSVKFTPFILLSADTTIFNPNLDIQFK
ncbi:hypothetical protein N6H18_11175 [Reichenbachiella agarivorans]|uniref:Uncharacterized protein n=1 Tax=Reichenbachiella agarivorans TaxID=2979464 RepID=A0ABY6CK98_9BACT|nr:hypothetical protein [Reichenbachiella agarivorans]UXP30912.1 hypothetical protein N6H18_11175 [Reichenbachiella agarivorans]